MSTILYCDIVVIAHSSPWSQQEHCNKQFSCQEFLNIHLSAAGGRYPNVKQLPILLNIYLAITHFAYIHSLFTCLSKLFAFAVKNLNAIAIDIENL